MVEPSTSEILAFAHELADAADEITLRYFRGGAWDAREKADGSPVTLADTETEQLLRKLIGHRFPEHAILDEEFGLTGSRDAPCWLLDPIDGTRDFTTGADSWGTFVALQRQGAVEVGVVSMPARSERWYAGRGLGAHLRSDESGQSPARLAVSLTCDLASADGRYRAERQDDWADWLQRLGDTAHAWRPEGAIVGLCGIVTGEIDAMIHTGPMHPWDIAPFIPIVEEAGGRITDSAGEVTVGSGHCIVSNGALHPALLRLLTN